jgi:hypothetical protein
MLYYIAFHYNTDTIHSWFVYSKIKLRDVMLYSLVEVCWRFVRGVNQTGSKQETGFKTIVHNITEDGTLHSHHIEHVKLKYLESL